MVNGAGVGFQCDFSLRFQWYARAYIGQQPVDALWRKQAGSAATKEYRFDCASPDGRQVLLKIGD